MVTGGNCTCSVSDWGASWKSFSSVDSDERTCVAACAMAADQQYSTKIKQIETVIATATAIIATAGIITLSLKSSLCKRIFCRIPSTKQP